MVGKKKHPRPQVGCQNIKVQQEVVCWDCGLQSVKLVKPLISPPKEEGEAERTRFFVCLPCQEIRKERANIQESCRHYKAGCSLSHYWLPENTPCTLRVSNPFFVSVADCPYSKLSPAEIIKRWQRQEKTIKKAGTKEGAR